MFESAPPPSEQSPEVLTDEEEPVDPPDSSADDADQAEPIPASSEGPAENWPEPEIPEEIYEPTEEGAEALIQYWFDARHHARITGDTEILNNVSLGECDLCEVQIDRVEEHYPTGWYVEDGPHEVHETYVQEDADGMVSGLFRLEQGGFDLYWEGELYSEHPDTANDVFGLAFRFEDQRWQAVAFTFIGEADEESVPENDGAS